MPFKLLRIVTAFAVPLALVVVMLGAYTRLTDAGLGCPDWPGCYGHLLLPSKKSDLQNAQRNYPQLTLEPRKAWTEMVHRYIAGFLGLLIFFIAITTLWSHKRSDSIPWVLPLGLLILVVFQAVLGMWTVTLKLLPVVVMGHLLGGILIFACLCCFGLQLSRVSPRALSRWHFWLLIGFIIVLGQILLGGWVSSNYAGIACIGFPTCNGQWFPKLTIFQAFNLSNATGLDYQGGLLPPDTRVTIQYIHRIGALISATYVLVLALTLLRKLTNKSLRILALMAILLVLIQFILGVLNVVYLLPLGIAVAHNGIAALLLATLAMMMYLTRGGPHGKG